MSRRSRSVSLHRASLLWSLTESVHGALGGAGVLGQLAAAEQRRLLGVLRLQQQLCSDWSILVEFDVVLHYDGPLPNRCP